MSPDYEKVKKSREDKIAEIRDMTNKLTQVVTHPEFLKALQKIEDTPPVKRMKYVSKHMTPTALAKKRIPMPKGFRITTRVFEDPDKPMAEFTQDRPLATRQAKGGKPIRKPSDDWEVVCTSVGYKVCVTVGGPVPPVSN